MTDSLSGKRDGRFFWHTSILGSLASVSSHLDFLIQVPESCCRVPYWRLCQELGVLAGVYLGGDPCCCWGGSRGRAMTSQYQGFVPVLSLPRGGHGPTVPKKQVPDVPTPGWKRVFVSSTWHPVAWGWGAQKHAQTWSTFLL